MPKTLDAFTEDKITNLIRKRDLKRSSNLKKEFNEINQHLYAKLKHTETDTRARSKEILKLILCKLVDEISNSLPDSIMSFSIGQDETEKQLFDRLQKFFKENLKDKYKNLIDKNERINLNKELVFLIVEKLQGISLLESSKDVLADTFEIFVSRLIKEEGGQFFTPASIIKFIVRYLNPETDSKVIDPACGHGGFLLECKDFLWSKIEQKYGDQIDTIKKKKSEIISNLYGIDKDSYLAKICELYLNIISQGNSNIFCEDSLDPSNYQEKTKGIVKNDYFDYVFTNPPFGAKIPIDIKEILIYFDLGFQK